MQYQGISEDDSFKGEQIMLKKQYLVGFKRFRYNSVLSAVNDCLETDIDVSSMALLQSKVSGHKNYDGWKIVSFGVIGESSRQRVLWNGQALSVVLKNTTSVAYGQKLLNKALAGTDEKTLKRLSKQYTASQGQY